MYLLNEETNTLINMDNIEQVFVLDDVPMVEVIGIGMNTDCLAEYEEMEYARESFKDIVWNIQLHTNDNYVYHVMTNEEAKQKYEKGKVK